MPTVTIGAPPADMTYVTYWSNDGTSSAGREPTDAASIKVNDGLFTVVLGDTTLANMTAIPASVFLEESTLQLRIWFNDGVNGFAALSPVQNLTPTPYAITALSANTTSNLSGTVSVGQLSGTVALGGSTPLTNAGVLSVTGNPDITATSLGGAVTLSDTATNSNTASAIVKRDPSGNFSAGTITATSFSGAFSGNGANLTALNADNLSSGTVPSAQLSGITGNQMAIATWQVAINLNGGNAALASNVVSGIGLTNAYITSALITNSTFAGNGNGLTNLDATQLSSGVIPLARLPVSVVTEGQTGATLSGNFSGNGAGLTNLNVSAAQLTSIGNTNGGARNFFVGPSGSATTTGYDNMATGNGALANTNSGSYNTALGNGALSTNTSGENNTAAGTSALNNNTSGADNTAVGGGALFDNASGSNNVAIGAAALNNNVAGSGNIAIGVYAGTSIYNGTNNIDIGNEGSGGESDTIRIGSTQTKAVVAGIYPTTTSGSAGLVCVNSSGLLGTGSAEAASLASDLQTGTGNGDYCYLQLGGGNSSGFLYGSYPALADGIHLGYNFYYDASGTAHVDNSGGATSRLTTGFGFIDLAVGAVNAAPSSVMLHADSAGVTVFGTFNNSSDHNAKQNFAPVSPSQILDNVLELPLSEWSYKTDSTTRHIGPMGQDFYSLFTVGTDEKHIAPIDEGGVVLAAIQGLNQKLEQKEREIIELKARLERLERLMSRQTEGPR